MSLHRRLFGHFRTDLLHLLLVGNTISLTPGLVTVATGNWPDEWFGWAVKTLQLLAVGLLGGLVVLEFLELRTRGDRRRWWDIPWPEST